MFIEASDDGSGGDNWNIGAISRDVRNGFFKFGSVSVRFDKNRGFGSVSVSVRF